MHVNAFSPHVSLSCERKREELATMTNVKSISSTAEIPDGQDFVLVTFGDEAGEKRDSHGVTITVPHGLSMAMSDLSFIAALHSAKEIAKREKISTVYACK